MYKVSLSDVMEYILENLTQQNKTRVISNYTCCPMIVYLLNCSSNVMQ